jgi:PPM family protein phosphatase
MLPSSFRQLLPSPSATDVPAPLGAASPEPVRLGQWLIQDGNLGWLIALVVLGALLFMVTGVLVYLIVRRGPSKRQKAGSLPNVAQNTLPKGTVLGDGRYVILGPLAGDSAAYEVQSTTQLLLCPTCHGVLEGQGNPASLPPSLCANCGALLDLDRSQHPLIAREIQAERFALVSELLSHQLAHRAIVMPVDAFEVDVSTTARYYQIEPLLATPPASSTKMPHPLDLVLAWGESLARGLDYLHEHRIALRGSALAAVAATDPLVADKLAADQAVELMELDGDEARWLCFDHVGSIASTDERAILAIFEQNVRGLALGLLKLAAGSAGRDALNALPDPVRGAFAQVLSRDGGSSAADFAAVLKQNRQELAYQQPARLVIGARSDVGQLRKLNEDSMLTRNYSDLFAPLGITVGVVAVADGVGGNSAGDVASRLTVEALADFGEGLRGTAANGHIPDPEPWLAQAATAANQVVYRERQSASNDMGCTLVMALFVGRAATLLNVGDSRAYRLRPKGINQVTTYHSLVQRLIEIGQLTREEARHHPQKSIIYRVMGDTPDLAYDIYDVVLQPGEALLLCSDGLTDMIEDDVVWQVWRAAASPDDACERLVTLANQAGGYDNITVVIAQIA